jgi:hypothetical protein
VKNKAMNANSFFMDKVTLIAGEEEFRCKVFLNKFFDTGLVRTLQMSFAPIQKLFFLEFKGEINDLDRKLFFPNMLF